MSEALNDVQLRAVQALARGMTRAEAAEESGCGERTLYTWLRDPGFQGAVQEASEAFFSATVAGLKCFGANAARYLNDVVTGRVTGSTDRLKAAQTLLNTMLNLARWSEVEELKRRIQALEGERS